MRSFSKFVASLVLFVSRAIAANQNDTEIVLRETTYSLNSDNTGDETRHERWKALTAKGRTDLNRIQIPYISSFQKVEFKVVRTLRKDGTVVDADLSSAFDTAPEANVNAPVFDDTRYRTILPPSLDIGDSLEYTAIIHIQHWLKPGEFWFVHYVGTDVRVLSEKVRLDLPADRKISFYEQPAGRVEIAKGRRIEDWEMMNAESIKPGVERAAPLFAVSSFVSWADFGEWLSALNADATRSTSEIAALAARLTANKSTEQDRIAALYSYVATKIRYTSVSFGQGRIQPHAASVVLHNAYGDCKDQTALLSALLRSAGFKSYAVLTTPGVGVLLRDVPTPDQFDHEFVAVDTKAGLQFLDSSMGPVQPGVLQPRVRGQSALLVSDKNTSVIDIPTKSPVPNKISVTLTGMVSAAGSFEGSSRFEFQGVEEIGVRRLFSDATETERDNLLRALSGVEFLKAKVRQVSNGEPYDLSKPFWIRCELSDPEFFSPQKLSMKVGLETGALVEFLKNIPKPEKPLPMETLAVSKDMDLAIDPSLTITNGMPVHRKAAFGALDAEFTYEKGHQMLAYSMTLNGTPIAPSDWTSFVEFLHSAQAEQATSFKLDRQITGRSSVGLSPIGKLLQDGLTAFNRRDYEAAKKAYLQATKLDPQSSGWLGLGRAYYALHEYEDAEKAYKRQIEVNPHDTAAYNNLGLVYRSLKRDDEAVESFRKQIAVSPNRVSAHDNLSISFAAMGQWEEALKEAAISVDLGPVDANRLFRLARAEVRTGHVDDAKRDFERTLAQPHDAMMENNIAYFAAEAGLDLNKSWQLISGVLSPEAASTCHPRTLSDGLADAQKCTSQLVRLSRMLDTAGWILYRQGRIEESKPYLWSAHAILPRAENEIHMAVVLAKSGHIDEALQYFAEANSRSDFTRVDSEPARRELATLAGSEEELDTRLKKMDEVRQATGLVADVFVLVDQKGKVLEARPADTKAPAALIEQAKSTALIPIAWPEHGVQAVRTITFRLEGGRWVVFQSYAGDKAP